MRFSVATLATVAAVASTAAAAPSSTNNLEARQLGPAQGPYALKIVSNNTYWNNKYITGTHVGAGIDQGVPATSPDKTYYLNGTYTDSNGTTFGEINYDVAPNIPFTASLNLNYSSNIAALWLAVVTPIYDFNFAKDGRLQINGVDNWKGCDLMTAYGVKKSIGWQFGKGNPTEKSCVDIKIYKE